MNTLKIVAAGAALVASMAGVCEAWTTCASIQRDWDDFVNDVIECVGERHDLQFCMDLEKLELPRYDDTEDANLTKSAIRTLRKHDRQRRR